jgi:heme exporter protein CcmD
MNGASHQFFILAAYGVTVVLLAIEVWTLLRRCRARDQLQARGPKHEG